MVSAFEVKLFVQKPGKGDACFATPLFSGSLAARVPLLRQRTVTAVKGSEEPNQCRSAEHLRGVQGSGWLGTPAHLSPRVAGYFPSAGELVSFAMPMLGLPKRYSLLKSHYSTEDL